jgi:hypothetical protein
MIQECRSWLSPPEVLDDSSLEKSVITGKVQVKALGIQNTHINSNVADGVTLEKNAITGKLGIKSGVITVSTPDDVTIERNGTTGKWQIKALGVRYSHLNSDVADASSIEKSGGTGKLQVKALGIQYSHLNANTVDASSIEKSTSTGKLQVKALGIQSTHLNSNVADGASIEKNSLSGKLAILWTKSGLCPRWKVQTIDGVLYTTPSQFVTGAGFSFSIESVGRIALTADSTYAPDEWIDGTQSTIFTMKIYANSMDLKTLHLHGLNGVLYCYLNNVLTFSRTTNYNGNANTYLPIVLSLVPGLNTVQFVYSNSGNNSSSLSIIGDLVDFVNTNFVDPLI